MCSFEDNFQIPKRGDDDEYRYVLGQVIDKNRKPTKTVCFIMLNPSTGNDQDPDPTMKKVIELAKRWGYSHLIVVNLFAYRKTKPKELASKIEREHIDPIGPENDKHIREQVACADKIIIAWGNSVRHINRVIGKRRDYEVLELIKDLTDPYCLCITEKEYPAHPNPRSHSLPTDITPCRWVEAKPCPWIKEKRDPGLKVKRDPGFMKIVMALFAGVVIGIVIGLYSA